MWSNFLILIRFFLFLVPPPSSLTFYLRKWLWEIVVAEKKNNLFGLKIKLLVGSHKVAHKKNPDNEKLSFVSSAIQLIYAEIGGDGDDDAQV